MRLSASALSRVSICPASAVLPKIETSNSYSETGTLAHAFLERAARIGREAALAQTPEGEVREMCERLDLDRLPLAGTRQEVAFAFDVLSGKAWEIGESIGRNYPALQDWQIAGTADVVRRAPGSQTVEIYDWKFGFGHDLHTAPVAENKQLRFLALAAARAAGVHAARIGIVYLPEHRITTHDLDAMDLAAIAAEMRDLYERVRCTEMASKTGATLTVRTGTHCRYCPAFQHCPAQTALVGQLLASPDAVEQETKALLTGENAPDAYARLLQIEAVAKAVRAALTAWARENPITTRHGTVYGPVTTERASVDGGVAFRVLRARFGEETAHAACELLTSKAAIERAVRAVAPKGEAAGAMREVLRAIEEAGGISTTPVETMKEHRPR